MPSVQSVMHCNYEHPFMYTFHNKNDDTVNEERGIFIRFVAIDIDNEFLDKRFLRK